MTRTPLKIFYFDQCLVSRLFFPGLLAGEEYLLTSHNVDKILIIFLFLQFSKLHILIHFGRTSSLVIQSAKFFGNTIFQRLAVCLNNLSRDSKSPLHKTTSKINSIIQFSFKVQYRCFDFITHSLVRRCLYVSTLSPLVFSTFRPLSVGSF